MASAEQYAAWIVQNQDRRGTPEFDTVAKAYQAVRGDSNSKYKALSKPEKVDPTEGMSFRETTAAGLGKMAVDTGRGMKQLLGIGDQKELQQTIDSEKELSNPLMNTWGGNLGNITGQIGAALIPGGAAIRVGNAIRVPGMAAAGRAMMAPPMNAGGAAIGVGMGAAQGGIQPVASDETRAGNMTLPAVAGGAVPLAGMGFGAAKGAIEPLYQGGRDAIVGRALNRAAGPGAPQAIQNMRGAQVLVPGSQPTAAEVAKSGGIAAMQRAASAVDPESYAARGAQQNAARVSALQDMAGTAGEREFHSAARSSIADDLYKQAYDKGIDIRRNPESGRYLPKAERAGVQGEITKLLQRPAIQDAVEKARVLAANEGVNMRDPGGSVQGLDYVKRALDDQIGKLEAGSNEVRILKDLKSRLLTTIDRLSPTYANARNTYTQMSAPINQMDVAQHIADRAINPMSGVLQPAAFGRAFNDDAAAAATGMRGATLERTMTPQQMGGLTAIHGDLARSVAAQNLGRGAGSDTVQKLSMTNLMDQSGLPGGLLNVYGMGALGRGLFSQSDDLMKQRLAEALLDPRQTAQLMQQARGNPQLRAAIEEVRRVMAPGLLGGALSLNAQQ